MSYTTEELNLVFDFLRARTVDKPGHIIQRGLLVGLMRRWAEENGYAARPDNRTSVALFQRAGYGVTRKRVDSRGRQFIEGLDLLPREQA